MTHTYLLKGMTCSSCEQKIKSALIGLEEVSQVSVSKDTNTATITMDQHISLSTFQKQIAHLGDQYEILPLDHEIIVDSTDSWWSTYRPIWLIFLYLLLVTGSVELMSNQVDILRWMRHFMAGFFLTFSFFKMLNLKGFIDSYKMYDVIARRFPRWGYIYAFMELLLGIAFLFNFSPFLTSIVTVILMTVSIIGVLQTVLNKKVIQCACLGDVFNLPMSTVTIIEDGLMIVMGLIMMVGSIAVV